MNLGFRAARAPFVFMISDDCLLYPGVVDEAIALATGDESVGAVAVPWRNWPEENSFVLGRTF